MADQHQQSIILSRLTPQPLLDFLGPQMQLMTSSEQADGAFSTMKGIMPPNSVVPLHSHTGAECFLMLSGTQDVLVESDGKMEWVSCHPGDYIYVPSGAKHAFRNVSDEDAVCFVTTTAKLGDFFVEAGRPVDAEKGVAAPMPDDLARFVETAIKYGYWLATPEENAAVGLML
jgi:quercetin dioxygenase-like cupin family protein